MRSDDPENSARFVDSGRGAFCVVYALQIDNDIWVIHAFQKKSTHGIKTPRHEIDLIKDRLKGPREMLE